MPIILRKKLDSCLLASCERISNDPRVKVVLKSECGRTDLTSFQKRVISSSQRPATVCPAAEG